MPFISTDGQTRKSRSSSAPAPVVAALVGGSQHNVILLTAALSINKPVPHSTGRRLGQKESSLIVVCVCKT
jgi:hypothetical protein